MRELTPSARADPICRPHLHGPHLHMAVSVTRYDAKEDHHREADGCCQLIEVKAQRSNTDALFLRRFLPIASTLAKGFAEATRDGANEIVENRLLPGDNVCLHGHPGKHA